MFFFSTILGVHWISKLQGLRVAKNPATKSSRQRTLGNNYIAGIVARTKVILNQAANPDVWKKDGS